ncbi:hypothetical protein EXIGLDRAFT_791335 [Exidia glandulosa HHB12029]|uniref:Uncharacterized protein n=1 Tax=Exidia glandulosa HHB12029 TaxID=1314781 RepID=A0A165HIL5_EXIGL|nr:hypothetical protein EXIGLDRAFT_791335 [Exidia glandulosa HHB12029]
MDLDLSPRALASVVLHQLLWPRGSSGAQCFEHQVEIDVEPSMDSFDDANAEPSRWTIRWFAPNDRVGPYSRLHTFNHIVLPEYKQLRERIDNDMNQYKAGSPRHGTVVFGQPGIGKTRFQAYLLFERLQERKPTILWEHTTNQYIFFAHDGVTPYTSAVDLYSRIVHLQLDQNDIVFLFDSPWDPMPPVATVHTTSPNVSRWNRVKMDLYDPASDNLAMARTAFEQGGGMLRTILNAARQKRFWDVYLEDRGAAIRRLVVSNKLKFLVYDGDSTLTELEDSIGRQDSYTIFVAVPTSSLSRYATLRYASDIVKRQLLDALCREAGPLLGEMYEEAVIRIFAHPRTLPIRGLRALCHGKYSSYLINIAFDHQHLLNLTPATITHTYTSFDDVKTFIQQQTNGDFILIPTTKNQANYDLLRVSCTTANRKEKHVRLVFFQVTAAESHSLKTTPLNDLWELFHNEEPLASKALSVEFHLIFVVPEKVFPSWTRAMQPQDVTPDRQEHRMRNGIAVSEGEHWRDNLNQYVASVDVKELFVPLVSNESSSPE